MNKKKLSGMPKEPETKISTGPLALAGKAAHKRPHEKPGHTQLMGECQKVPY